MNRREFLHTISAGAAIALSPVLIRSCARQPEDRPNVIVIITDDQGYGDFGYTGNPVIRTPNIDALAEQSAEMTRFYVSPVCAPTRASLMTGRYNYRTRVVDTYIGRAMMEPDEVTLAEILRDTGYATGIFGKWHLGDNYPMRPQDQGFDEVLVHRGGGIGQPSDPPEGEGQYTDPVLFHNGEKTRYQGYCTDIYFEQGMQWMEAAQKQGQNFFMYLPTNAPHGPFDDVPEALYREYKQMNLGNNQFPQEEGHPLPEEADTDRRARIYAMITNIDGNVGRLLARLDQLGIADNTVVMFLVDNGPNGRRYVAGMRGSKSSVYEGGIRSPFWVRWPARLSAGRKSDRIAAHIDILPTVLEACDVPVPEGIRMDGKSLLPLLQGEDVTWPDRHIVIQAHRGNEPVRYHNFMIRNQRWKLLHPSGFGNETFQGEPEFELYDMSNDPLETEDLADQRPGVVADLRARYEQWLQNVSTTRPDNYAPPRIHIGTPHENPTVLTRQDWRHVKGRPWGTDSNGFWMLYAASSGAYDIRLRFHNPLSAPGEAELELGGQTLSQPLSEGQSELVFEQIRIEKGDLNLQATLHLPDKTRGPWQVDVIKL